MELLRLYVLTEKKNSQFTLQNPNRYHLPFVDVCGLQFLESLIATVSSLKKILFEVTYIERGFNTSLEELLSEQLRSRVTDGHLEALISIGPINNSS